MKAQFSSCGKRSTKNQSEQLQPVAVGAMGLVCDEFGARFLAALRLAFRLQTSAELEQFLKSINILFALLHILFAE